MISSHKWRFKWLVDKYICRYSNNTQNYLCLWYNADGFILHPKCAKGRSMRMCASICVSGRVGPTRSQAQE